MTEDTVSRPDPDDWTAEDERRAILREGLLTVSEHPMTQSDPTPPPSLDVEERRDAFAAIRLALKGARGMALDSDETALDAELGKAIDLLDWLSTEPSE